jgi:hypothetical protein
MFSPSTSVSPANLRSTNCSTIIIIIHHLGLITIGQQWPQYKLTQSQPNKEKTCGETPCTIEQVPQIMQHSYMLQFTDNERSKSNYSYVTENRQRTACILHTGTEHVAWKKLKLERPIQKALDDQLGVGLILCCLEFHFTRANRRRKWNWLGSLAFFFAQIPFILISKPHTHLRRMSRHYMFRLATSHRRVR